jgi:hypothetical protein
VRIPLKIDKTALMLALAMAVFLLGVPHPWADEGDAGWAGAALRMGIDARAMGMGGAYVSLAQGASATYWNPAAISHHRLREVTFSYSHLPWDRRLVHASAVMPVEPAAGVGLAWIHAGVDGIEGRDYNGQPTGTLTSAENAFYLAFSAQFAPFLNAGLGMKYLYYKLADISATGFGFDACLFSSPLPDMTLGLVVQDLNAKYTWDTEDVWALGTTTYDEFPVNVRFGASYRLLQQRLTVAADVEKNEKQSFKPHLGAEYSIHPSLMARVGLDEDTPTFGASLIKPISSTSLHLDYALLFDTVTSDASHIFTWHFQF